MTTVMNEKLARSYMKSMEDKLVKKVKCLTKKITTEDIVSLLLQILPSLNIDSITLESAMQTIHRNQQIILDNQCKIAYLTRKEKLENQLTASFIKNLVKERLKINNQGAKVTGKKQNSLFLNTGNCSAIFRQDSSRILNQQSILEDSIFDKSPIGSISGKQDEDFNRYGACNTSRSKYSPAKYKLSETTNQILAEEREKARALAKLRKLQKYVFEKENIRKDKSLSKIWNYGVSPTKMRYQEENQNLKAIQSNLVTHLSLLQKFRETPSVESLIAKEDALKKKEKQLKQLGDILEKKELSLNKQHSQFLKKQKSQRVL